MVGFGLSLHLLLEVYDGLGRFVKLLVEKDVKVATWIVEEVLNEATIEEVTVDVQLLVSVNHVFVLKRV